MSSQRSFQGVAGGQRLDVWLEDGEISVRASQRQTIASGFRSFREAEDWVEDLQARHRRALH